MNNTENLLRRAALETNYGWTKLNCNAQGATPSVAEDRRIIRIGNNVNCNGEIMKNLKISENIENIMKHYEINDYILNIIDTKYEYSSELILRESVYQEFCNKIQKNINKR